MNDTRYGRPGSFMMAKFLDRKKDEQLDSGTETWRASGTEILNRLEQLFRVQLKRLKWRKQVFSKMLLLVLQEFPD